MSDNTSSPSASGITTEAIGLLLSKFEEQNHLIRQLSDRIAQLENRSSGPPSIASPIPVPQGEAWAAFFKAHAESLASRSNPSSPSPSVSVGHNASAFSPPPFGYPYGPYPGYYHPMQHPHWPQPNQPATTGQSLNNNSTDIISERHGAATRGEQGAHVTADRGQATSSSATNTANGSNYSNYSRGAGSRVIPCKFGDRCNRPDCRFEHSSNTNPDLQPKGNPNPTYALNQPQSDVTPNPGNISQQSGASTKSRPDCNYGENCTRKKCSFTHPLGRKPPSDTPKPTVDQNPTAVVATSATGQVWGASISDNSAWGGEETTKDEPSNEWEQWEVKPSNDWGTPSNNNWGTSSANDWGTSTTNEWGTPSNAASINPSSRSENKSKKGSTAKKSDGNKAKTAQTGPVTPQVDVPAEPVVANDTHESATDLSADIEIPSLASEPSIADAVVDSLPTPVLEPVHTSNSLSSLSESDNPQTPFAWGDEPLNSAETNEQPPGEPASRDAIAPSSMYGSWGPVESSGWGPDDPAVSNAWGAESLVVPTNKGKSSVKAKGKQKEPNEAMPINDSWNENAKTSATEPDSWASASVEGSQTIEPQSTPVPQGVPEDEIPDWLLGGEEDPYAALGISRPTTPKPTAPASKPPLPPPLPRGPRISEMNGANFPPPKPDSNRQPPKTSVASGPTIRPRRTAWTIVSSGEQSTTQKDSAGSAKDSGKGSGKQPNKRYHNKKQNAKGSK